MSQENSLKPETIYVRVKKSINYDDIITIICIIVIIGALTIIQVMMIVYGSMYPDVVCKSPCISYECDMPSNKDYILTTPPIGISPSIWLICGGCFGILFIFILVLVNNKSGNIFNNKYKTVRLFVVLLCISWLIVGAIVYDQTLKQCKNVNSTRFIESKAFDWLKGTMIGGFCFIVGPFVLSIVLSMLCCVNCGCDMKNERQSFEYNV